MAREVDAIPANVSGDFFVDSSCIDCDLCRQLAPASFARADSRAHNRTSPRQPTDATGCVIAL